MAVTHSTNTRNAAANAVVDRIDLGSTDPNGDLVFMTSGDVEVATCEYANPAYGDAVAGVANANAIADDTNATGGTVALFKIQDRDNVEVLRGTVTAVGGGGDKEISSVTVAPGETISTSSQSYTAPV